MLLWDRCGALVVLSLTLNDCIAFLPQHSTLIKQSTDAQPTKDLETTIQDEDPVDRPRHIRFIHPLLEYGYRPAVDEYESNTLVDKPILLYLPGFDGTFLSPFLQFPELQTIFDIRCMVISTRDRSTFDEVCETVVDYITKTLLAETPSTREEDRNTTNTTANIFGRSNNVKQAGKIPNRSVYLAGESFGGIVALSVVGRLKARSDRTSIKGLALINAATCYDRSRLAIEGPKVVNGGRLLYAIGLAKKLLPLFTDQYSFDQLLLMVQAKALPSVIDDEAREAYLGRVAFSLPFVIPFISQDTLQWRLEKWLTIGCNETSGPESLSAIEMPTLIIAGETDATLPSIAEADRLSTVIPGAVVHVVDGAGHASTCGSRVDLAALFRFTFPELRSEGGRLRMKAKASAGQGAYFGMEPRYDNATVGLSPWRYWTRKLFRFCEAPSVEYIIFPS